MFHDYAPVFIIGMLNSFAEKTENGIIDFDTYVTDPEKYDGFLIYDKSNGKVVCDMCVDELHSDIVGYFDFFDGVDIRVIEDDGIFVDVDFGRSSIVVENGRWYVSNFDYTRGLKPSSEIRRLASPPFEIFDSPPSRKRRDRF